VLIFISLLKVDLALKETKIKKKSCIKDRPYSRMNPNQPVQKSDVKSTQESVVSLPMVKTGAIE
jgi:hypothetical protein